MDTNLSKLNNKQSGTISYTIELLKVIWNGKMLFASNLFRFTPLTVSCFPKIIWVESVALRRRETINTF